MELGIDLDIISVKSSNSFVGDNNSITTGSRGSELTCSVGLQFINLLPGCMLGTYITNFHRSGRHPGVPGAPV